MPIPEEPIPNECARCGGDGVSDEPDTECPVCFGFGMLPLKGVAKKLIDIKPPNVYHTYQIVEALDDTEYGSLNTSQKAIYALIISAGMVDLSAGTRTRAKLWEMFGEGTTTRSNLEAL